MKCPKKYVKIIKLSLLFCVFIFFAASYYAQNQLEDIYKNRESKIIKDRNGREISILPNQNGYWARYSDNIPSRFKELLLKKEDRYFYYHPGFNPWSISQAAARYLGFGNRRASSTITQQLAKILLGKESERNLKNKIIEGFYALSLEIYQSKENILKMYANSVYFGNQAQGLAEAARLYFDLSPDLLTDGEILQLLSSVSNPSGNNPAKPENSQIASGLARRLGGDEKNLSMDELPAVKENMRNYPHSNDAYFEIEPLAKDSTDTELTIDLSLTERVRSILDRNIEELRPKNVNQGAVIVLKLPENEALALVGSADPRAPAKGSQINMLKEPRPIGSTIKPFIYLKGFEKDLRPYSLADDREYKYITALGFPLYPKNFDYKYRGEVSLHYALSNSLNVPSVKVLEYVGLENFYDFLEKDLGLNPVQSLDNYQLGIALGSLEMNMLDLADYFTIFPNEGVLKKIKIFKDETSSGKIVAKKEHIQLINKILNDRKTGIEQFGMKSWLNLFQENYALKTGTSRDFRDSWIVGFTPDFLVLVWLGNADNSPMDEVSGQIGAGRVWAQVMELLLNSEYNKKTPFNFDAIRELDKNGNIEYGLEGDNYEKSRSLLKDKDSSIILNPHSGDNFLLEKDTEIALRAKEKVKWFVNNAFLTESSSAVFAPKKTGRYRITAATPNGSQETIYVSLSE